MPNARSSGHGSQPDRQGCDYFIPLAPSWMIGERSKVVVHWERVAGSDKLSPKILVVADQELASYKNKKGATIIDSRVVDPFDPTRTWSIEALRGPGGLRRWSSDQLTPNPEDVFQERLYCIRWISADGKTRYAAPDHSDIDRETLVLRLLRERFPKWQRDGFVPSMAIPADGEKTDEPIRTRGWTQWHQLFTPRQLLVHGILAEIADRISQSHQEKVACLLGMGRIVNWNSKLSQWLSDAAHEGGNHVFYSQALNSFYNYPLGHQFCASERE